jgi:hypothetical protein
MHQKLGIGETLMLFISPPMCAQLPPSPASMPPGVSYAARPAPPTGAPPEPNAQHTKAGRAVASWYTTLPYLTLQAESARGTGIT